ncbi:RagB/SusD family nutrient uptake outer membrane protein [uncultured Christiangramia sp.]|uniref:RagB/SusD family nutrient uptake outer membrane protein n=1 Tax=uncultured Christiangramia sp. TaxID=503836 RepID=UPI0025E3FD75|nr:RagB/SusD family nutrient uptake outer membrane protein [uncultured Christiangramia sp.]|tara:strand:- start:2194 stop:3621 length:1428 start_codon:yes stop_codon:yes gene_type:complete
MKKSFKYLFMLMIGCGVFVGCSDEDLDPTLQQSKDIDISVNTQNDLNAIINGAYNRMSLTDYYGRDYIILGEVFSDNTASNANSNRFVAEARMDLLPTSGVVETLWSRLYSVIGSANIVINSEGITGDQAAIDQIKGEAYVIRALAHFNLVQFYGQQNVNNGGLSAAGVPYVTAFRDDTALFPGRNTVQEVRDMAYADLDMAKSLMGASAPVEYFSTYAASAIEARIANYFGDWQRSLDAAKTVIDSGQFSVVSEDAFLSTFSSDGGTNSIFEIAASDIDNEGINGLANIYQQGAYGDVVVLPNLAAIYDEGDVRGVSEYDPSTDYEAETVIGVDANGTLRNIGKYPSTAPYDDNIPVIRYEEVVLIYAEALLETSGDDSGDALDWLNMIPENRGAMSYDSASKDNVLLERRKELAFEGFRFHDLARTMMDIPNPDPVLQTHEGPAYGSFNFALPIPAAEVDANSNIPQNAGYGE